MATDLTAVKRFIPVWFRQLIQNDHQARRRFVEWAQNEIAVVPDFHKRILFSDEAHFGLNGYVNKQNCHIWKGSQSAKCMSKHRYIQKTDCLVALWAGNLLLK
ncbi:hypothetical protein TNCV_4441201 [Trichonephila clavipes]|nr:hypothetical protein TNCV_4441201 [Trichonephila clavipes]